MSSTSAPGVMPDDQPSSASRLSPGHHSSYGHQLADAACLAFSQWRDGDDQALDRLVHLLSPMLWHLARAYRVDSGAAEDAVQSTWLSLVRSADRIEQPQAVLRWLSVTVQREAARASRSTSRTQPTDPDDMPDRPGDDHPVAVGPESVVIDRADSTVLWSHVTRLSERCQRLLRVIAFSDRPEYHELSRELGMPVGSIGPTRARCLGKLRDSLATDPAWSRS